MQHGKTQAMSKLGESRYRDLIGPQVVTPGSALSRRSCLHWMKMLEIIFVLLPWCFGIRSEINRNISQSVSHGFPSRCVP